eukprot:TRINITY_DN8762_c0_g1_i1.p1 TRINITY_DN8762_c0_g1~~TRINITY_DN8762_c0_g1_i1.p1  ORF type:complete len:375 (-),score=87.79 TRINITY_DN8762_c0_g1_i1:82-1206(-)
MSDDEEVKKPEGPGIGGIKDILNITEGNHQIGNFDVRKKIKALEGKWAPGFRGKKVQFTTDERQMSALAVFEKTVFVGFSQGHLLRFNVDERQWTASFPGHRNRIGVITVEKDHPNRIASASCEKRRSPYTTSLMLNDMNEDEPLAKTKVKGIEVTGCVFNGENLYCLVKTHSMTCIYIFNEKLEVTTIAPFINVSYCSDLLNEKNLFYFVVDQDVMSVDLSYLSFIDNNFRPAVHGLNLQTPGTVTFSASSTGKGNLNSTFTYGTFQHQTSDLEHSWVQVDLGDKNAMILSHYSFKSGPEFCPKGWILQATNEFTNIILSLEDPLTESGWVTLSEKKDQETEELEWYTYKTSILKPNQKVAYRAFRFVQTQKK